MVLNLITVRYQVAFFQATWQCYHIQNTVVNTFFKNFLIFFNFFLNFPNTPPRVCKKAKKSPKIAPKTAKKNWKVDKKKHKILWNLVLCYKIFCVKEKKWTYVSASKSIRLQRCSSVLIVASLCTVVPFAHAHYYVLYNTNTLCKYIFTLFVRHLTSPAGNFRICDHFHIYKFELYLV